MYSSCELLVKVLDEGDIHILSTYGLGPYTRKIKKVVFVFSPSCLVCSVLFCFVLFCSVLFCSVLFCSVLCCVVLCYLTLPTILSVLSFFLDSLTICISLCLVVHESKVESEIKTAQTKVNQTDPIYPSLCQMTRATAMNIQDKDKDKGQRQDKLR